MSGPAAWRPGRASAGLGAFGVSPITAADLKAHCRIDFSEDDVLVGAYLAAAADHVERHTGRLLTERSCTLKLPGFPPRADQDIALPGGRCASVASIAYVDAGASALSLPPEDWEADLLAVPARIALAGGSMWPVARGWGLPVTVSYVAGYPAGGQPPALLQAVRMLASELYEQRRDSVIGAAVSPVILGAHQLMQPLVLYRMM